MTTSPPRPRTAAAVAPHHLLVGPDTHGVTRYAGEVADAAGAPIVRDARLLTAGSGSTCTSPTGCSADPTTRPRWSRRWHGGYG